jgi:hypothetical protein
MQAHGLFSAMNPKIQFPTQDGSRLASLVDVDRLTTRGSFKTEIEDRFG